MRTSIKDILAEYGRVALWVYFVIFALVLVGSWAAIHMGWQPEGVAGGMGTLGAAWVATKLTQPLRIGATLVLTPLVAKLYEKLGGKPAASRVRAEPIATATPAPVQPGRE